MLGGRPPPGTPTPRCIGVSGGRRPSPCGFPFFLAFCSLARRLEAAASAPSLFICASRQFHSWRPTDLAPSSSLPEVNVECTRGARQHRTRPFASPSPSVGLACLRTLVANRRGRHSGRVSRLVISEKTAQSQQPAPALISHVGDEGVSRSAEDTGTAHRRVSAVSARGGQGPVLCGRLAQWSVLVTLLTAAAGNSTESVPV